MNYYKLSKSGTNDTFATISSIVEIHKDETIIRGNERYIVEGVVHNLQKDWRAEPLTILKVR